MAIRMSMQRATSETKRSKPQDAAVGAVSELSEDSPGSKTRRRELMVAVVEKRIVTAVRVLPSSLPLGKKSGELGRREELRLKSVNLSKELSVEEANQLFSMVFGNEVSKRILAQWSNQEIRFNSDLVTSMGLVQHEGGPCGILAAIQAFVLKHIIFFSGELKDVPRLPQKGLGASFKSVKVRALVRSMAEILFSCGSNIRAVIATLSFPENDIPHFEGISEDEVIVKSLQGLSIESVIDLNKFVEENHF
ncbi:probable ubiquitin carboxyl-terminal hydrolase MINDY-4 [Vigna radiata var. radiata]|uniref:Probable ubiquitin carboxyl-terminal hydrolase MINDY-4 n=1 Tax=Vigna radiata var. radiata TaxID=3916 RepID=A0A1S3V001_VIGRR|nr:probable ubiquitin carboxyl-terminal hydrolase MINDY-4 [Vigna radiata var. radiata]